MVHFLDEYFGKVDEICQQHNVEKIKTIGDCYMCVGWTQKGVCPQQAALQVLPITNLLHDSCIWQPAFH